MHRSALAQVEDFRAGAYIPPPRGYSPDYQIILPYHGLFEWAVGKTSVYLDANRLLFAGGGEEYAERHPVADLGHSSAVVTPSIDTIDELCGRMGARRHRAFQDVSRPASMRARLLGHRLLAASASPLERDELVLDLMRDALGTRQPSTKPTASRLIHRTKEYLHAHAIDRICLPTIAGELGVSPIYLTQAFKASQGVPLYRYQMQLRLSSALRLLEDCEDITTLALTLGFSSHAHFSAAFKTAFGTTPSEHRAYLCRSC